MKYEMHIFLKKILNIVICLHAYMIMIIMIVIVDCTSTSSSRLLLLLHTRALKQLIDLQLIAINCQLIDLQLK